MISIERLIGMVLLIWMFCCAPILEAEFHKFKIGMILPLSGPAADYGQSIENCVGMAQSDHPELFSNIQFVYEDVSHDSNRAVSAFRKLTTVDKVDLVYTWGVPFCKVLAPIAESQKFPLVGQCIDQVSSAGRKYVLRFMNYTDQYLQIQTKSLRDRGLMRIGIVLAEHPYLEEMYAALKRNLLPGQTVSLIDSYQIGDFDLRSTIAKIRQSDFDTVGVFLYPGQIAQFYRQSHEQKLKLPTFGTNFFESISELRLAEGTMEGAEFANNTINPFFAERYSERFKNVSQLGFGALGYEFSLLIGKLFNSNKKAMTSEQIISRLSKTPNQPGIATGPFQFRESLIAGKYFDFSIAVKVVRHNKFEILGPVNEPSATLGAN